MQNKIQDNGVNEKMTEHCRPDKGLSIIAILLMEGITRRVYTQQEDRKMSSEEKGKETDRTWGRHTTREVEA